jgi:hypothetical protein
MVYQLVLITNLGIITLLGTFRDQGSCLQQLALMKTTQQHSAECLPIQNLEDFKKQTQEQNKSIGNLVQEIQRIQR